MKTTKNLLAAIITFISTLGIAQIPYSHDRVYTANQVSNTVSVINPATNILLGEIRLGKPYPNVLSPLYKGQALVHGLRYSKERKMLAVVSIGSNSLTLISTETNMILKTIYIGRSPHEPTFTPDSKQIWVSVRGEAYISVIDVDKMEEVKKITVADGPSMVSFSPDGSTAYVCSSFSPELDIVSTSDFQVIKRIPVTSPFSPNIFTSPDGKWVALTHKDIGKVTVINTKENTIEKVIETGPITNHVTFSIVNKELIMLVTVGGENKVKAYNVLKDFKLQTVVNVGDLPHGIWASPDGKQVYIGIEYGDQVQAIDLSKMKVIATIPIGQSPQALVYADDAVTNSSSAGDLSPLNDKTATQVITFKNINESNTAKGRIAVRSIGLADLIEQSFGGLKPKTAYVLALTKSSSQPYASDYQINSFISDDKGLYSGQSTGLVKSLQDVNNSDYLHVILVDTQTNKAVLIDHI